MLGALCISVFSLNSLQLIVQLSRNEDSRLSRRIFFYSVIHFCGFFCVDFCSTGFLLSYQNSDLKVHVEVKNKFWYL